MYASRKCAFPPPCGSDYSQFKMSKGGPACCRRKKSVKKSIKKVSKSKVVKKCPKSKKRCPTTGRCVLKKNVKKCGSTAKKVAKVDGFDLKRAKDMLKKKYAQSINGKLKVPSFLSSMTTVNGKTSADKIANINRVLITCKKMGVPLLKKDGKMFKSYRTLVSQCSVRFRKASPSGVFERAAKRIVSRRSAPGIPDLIDLADSGSYTPPDLGDYVPPEYIPEGYEPLPSSARKSMRSYGRRY